ncbi:hypothetical protein [Acetobacter sp.]
MASVPFLFHDSLMLRLGFFALALEISMMQICEISKEQIASG